MNGYSTLSLSRFPRAQRGFTLVELSIVLVIIGLLIGGLLVAQSMIETTKIDAQIKQLQQFDIALRLFKTKFNRLPGDPDNDGVIGNDVFYELSVMSGLKGDYISVSGLGATDPVFGPGHYAPYAEIGKGGIMAGQSANRDVFWMLSGARGCVKQNWQGFGGDGANTCALDALSPTQALSIDTKTDDSNPYTGNFAVIVNNCVHSLVYAPGSIGADPQMTDPDGYAFAFRQDCQGCVANATNKYNVALDNHLCPVQVKADNQF